MYDYVIVHGSFGNQYGNWFQWLFEQLENDGKKVLCPQFPTPNNQNLDSWTKVLDGYSDFFDENTSFITHSLAPAFIMDYVVEKKINIKDFFAVAPFYGLINITEFDDVNKSFFIEGQDLSKIQDYTRKRHFIFSDNDPYVPQVMSEDMSKMCGAEITIVPGGEHLNSGAGFDAFPQLLQIINTYE